MLCTSCGETVTGEGPPTVCSCGHPLEVRFNWGDGLPFREGISQALPSLWRYLSVLPPLPEDQITTLNEGWTPLIDAGEYEGISVSFKDETMNPTGSFKDRGMTMAVSHLRPFGVRHVCLPSAGNAGVAAAAYCSKAGIGCHLFLPERIPGPFVEEAKRYGADVTLAGKTMAQAAARMERDRSLEWFDLSTLREPFRVEGKKTLGYEIAEQLGWGFPDAVIYPTGGGTGLIGMWKAFNEIRDLGWTTDELPRMVAVQSSGCAPVVRAFADGEDQVRPWEESHTAALGLHAPNPLGGRGC
ncbi:MAG: threonine synthase [Fidelibacterota bacterium]